MRAICLGIFLVLSPALAAQEEIPNSGTPDLIITKSKLGSIIGIDTSRGDPPPKIDESQQFKGSPPSFEWQAKIELEVQNTGSKKIKSVVWQFLLTVGTNPVKTFQSSLIRSKKEIKPGESVKLKEWIKGAYLKELRRAQKTGLLHGHGEIKRINY
jgi:hypothetical protein